MTEFRALASYVHELHVRLGRLLLRDLNDATDAWYRPHEGGLLEAYLRMVDEMGDRFDVLDDAHGDRFYAERSTNRGHFLHGRSVPGPYSGT